MIFTNYSSLLALLQTIIIGAGGLATAILAVWGLWSKILKPWFKESREKREALSKAIVHIEDISEKLEKVSKELQPNGGGSIKDQVKQIANDVKIIRVERDATFYLSKEPMIKTDGEGHCISANYAICNLFGISQNEMLGLGWLNSIQESDRARVKQEWENIIESGSEISTYFSIKNPITEEIIHLKYKAIINKDNENTIVSIIGTVEKTTKKFYKKLNIV